LITKVAPATSTTAAAPSIRTTDAADVAEQGGVLTTTFHHPFYDLTQTAFVEAQHLHPGDRLQTPTGYALVTGIRLYHANTTTYDLTIGNLHTYYVVAGSTPVLVHNSDGIGCGPFNFRSPNPDYPPNEKGVPESSRSMGPRTRWAGSWAVAH
jgi:hypothetical protein